MINFNKKGCDQDVLVANMAEDKPMSLAESYRLDELKALRARCHFHCPVCGRPVTLRLGKINKWHFAHNKAGSCTLESEPESPHHLKGKRSLFHWLQDQHSAPQLEHYLPKLHQRPDIYLPEPPLPKAIEYQCTTMPPSLFIKRTKGYHQAGIEPIWILGAGRIKQKGMTFTLASMDTLAIRSIQNTAPQLFSSSYVLATYCPEQNAFRQLTNLHTLSKNKFMGTLETTRLDNATLETLLHPPPNHPAILKSSWLFDKKMKRLANYPHQSPTEKYVRTICYNNHLVYSAFPSYVGLPHANNLLIETTPALWQAWLILTFIFQKHQSVLDIVNVTNAFQNMIDREIFKERILLCQRPSLSSLVRSYLNQLSLLKVLEPLGRSTFRVIHNEQWPQKTMEQWIVEDRLLLGRLEEEVQKVAK